VVERKQSSANKEYSPATDTNNPENGLLTLAQADLLAQKRMAYWTVWISVFTALGLGVLAWTLYETRRMTLATRRIGEAQVRPWISIKDMKVTGLRVSPIHIGDERPKGFSLHASFTIRNTGPMPAEAILTYFGLHDPSETESSFAEWQKDTADSFVAGATRNDVGKSFPPESEEVLRPMFGLRTFTEDEMEEGSFVPFFSIFVRYFIPGERTARVFVQGYMVVRDQGPDIPTGSILSIDSVERDREIKLMADPIGISRAG
tara:strand:+ start:81472 stop:82254 length:783 start_codon:yes stop_codon:yes gene_type:complete